MTLQVQLFPATLMPDQGWWQALWPAPDCVVGFLQVAPRMRVLDRAAATATLLRRLLVGSAQAA